MQQGPYITRSLGTQAPGLKNKAQGPGGQDLRIPGISVEPNLPSSERP